MDLEDKDDRDLTGPEESPPVSEAARPLPPPPTEVDPAYDPLYIDPDDPLYIPVPLGDAPDEPDGGPLTAPMEAARPEPDAEANDPPATPEPPPPPPAETGSEEAETETVAATEAAGVAPAEVEEPIEATATVTAIDGDEDKSSATAEGERTPRRRKKMFILLAALLGLALVGIAGIAYAGYDYSKKYDGRILPGATVAGVDVGGMSPDEALETVRKAVRPQLTRTIEISWEDRTWTVTPKELGATSNSRAAVDAALEASTDTSFIEKTRMRVLGDDLAFTNDVAVSYPRRGARGFVQGLASSLHREPRDAGLDYSTGWVEITPSRRGRSVNTARSLSSLRQALVEGSPTAELSVRIEEPAVTEDAFEKVILVRIGENKAYLYEDGKITHEYLVATGQPAYPTPTGVFEITEKRYMPTWVNPAPDGWGSSMPASIPPGISNPLGLRALNWSASGIRFHGTTATYSLGYNASHGCVRMSNDAVIELYDLVDVGTPIVSLESAAYNPLYEDSSGAPSAENSAN
jgi:lipoprotein-anchoring transpeptidase ErfK/SrfK